MCCINLSQLIYVQFEALIRIANFPDRLGPSGKSVENSTKLRCLEIAGYTGQQNLTFFGAHEEKYLILIDLLTLNSNV